MNKSAINYCDRVWNVTGGCTHCSPGCDNCWAEQLTATRFKDKPRYDGLTKDGKWTGKVKLFEDRLDQPLRVKESQVVFVNSQSDLFHPQVPFEFIDKIFQVMTCYPQQHKFLLLTKRADRMLEYISALRNGLLKFHKGQDFQWPFKNIYPGLTICNQVEADEKLPVFLQIPGHKWLSIEPCLGGVDLEYIKDFSHPNKFMKYERIYSLSGERNILGHRLTSEKIEQVIVGGESGRGARPLHPAWPRSIRDQCVAAGVPFFFKQWGKFVAPKDTAYHGSHKGWRFLVGCSYMKHDGTYYPGYPSGGLSGWTKIYRIGTAKAGRLLDGVEHNKLIWRP